MLKCVQCGQTDPGRFSITGNVPMVLHYARTDYRGSDGPFDKTDLVPIFKGDEGGDPIENTVLLCDCGAEEPIDMEGWDYE